MRTWMSQGEVYTLRQGPYGTFCEKEPDVFNLHGANDLLFVYAAAVLVPPETLTDWKREELPFTGLVMTRAEINAIRDRAGAQKYGPWVTDYVEMAKKTALRRLAKLLPKDVKVGAAINADETTPDYSHVLEPVIADAADAGETDETCELEETMPDVD